MPSQKIFYKILTKTFKHLKTTQNKVLLDITMSKRLSFCTNVDIKRSKKMDKSTIDFLNEIEAFRLDCHFETKMTAYTFYALDPE